MRQKMGHCLIPQLPSITELCGAIAAALVLCTLANYGVLPGYFQLEFLQNEACVRELAGIIERRTGGWTLRVTSAVLRARLSVVLPFLSLPFRGEGTRGCSPSCGLARAVDRGLEPQPPRPGPTPLQAFPSGEGPSTLRALPSAFGAS
jgi:hypothetical protein